MSKKGPETKLKQQFRAWLLEQGAYIFSPVQTGFGKRTVDDLICLRGVFIAAEAKAPGKYADPFAGCTALQKEAIRDVNAAGGFGFAYDDLEKAKQLIRSRGLA